MAMPAAANVMALRALKTLPAPRATTASEPMIAARTAEIVPPEIKTNSAIAPSVIHNNTRRGIRFFNAAVSANVMMMILYPYMLTIYDVPDVSICALRTAPSVPLVPSKIPERSAA